MTFLAQQIEGWKPVVSLHLQDGDKDRPRTGFRQQPDWKELDVATYWYLNPPYV